MNMNQSILYVDIENLQDAAKLAIVSVFENWPVDFPRAGTIKLYVKADQTELWRIWINHNLPSVKVDVKGVQHYTFTGSKNSADLFLALDALADLLKGRTRHIAVMSDDSDFAYLFAAVKQELDLTENPEVLFKWFMTNRSDTRSQMLIDFFPSKLIHTVILEAPNITLIETEKDSSYNGHSSEEEMIARAIIENTPIGLFKSADGRTIIARFFPKHHWGKADNATFGTQFSKVLWPILERYGVRLSNPGKKPRKYEMTEEAKVKIR